MVTLEGLDDDRVVVRGVVAPLDPGSEDPNTGCNQISSVLVVAVAVSLSTYIEPLRT